MTYYIRFPDKVTGMNALDAAGLLTADDHPITASHTHALDVIGIITIGGEWDEDGSNIITAHETLPGWHVNYIGNLPDGWDEFIVTPEHPVRVWA